MFQKSAVRSHNQEECWGGMKHGQEMDLKKQQIKRTQMKEKRCNFLMWNLIALHPHLNLLFQASVSC